MVRDRFQDIPTVQTQEKLAKAIKLYAMGASSRSIEVKVHMDRQSLKRWMDYAIPFTKPYLITVRNAALHNDFTYLQFMEKFGKKGLTALFKWFKDKSQDERKSTISKIKLLRDKGVTYREIADLTGKSISSMQRTMVSVFGSKSITGNARVNKVKERDFTLLAKFKEGISIPQLAYTYKLSPITIRSIIHNKFGVRIKKVGIAVRHYDRVKLLLTKGMTWKEIAYVIRDGATPQSLRKSYEEEHFRRIVNAEDK